MIEIDFFSLVALFLIVVGVALLPILLGIKFLVIALVLLLFGAFGCTLNLKIGR